MIDTITPGAVCTGVDLATGKSRTVTSIVARDGHTYTFSPMPEDLARDLFDPPPFEPRTIGDRRMPSITAFEKAKAKRRAQKRARKR